MRCKELLKLVHDRLFSEYGICQCPLIHDTPFQLLAAVMLSAQCRDERVNAVTRQLFQLAPDAPAMAATSPDEIEKIIHPCGLSGSKSRNLHASSCMIVDKFGSEVPASMEDLIQLPGIGRKSANVILGNCFGIPGFPVDTHVRRVLNRIGAVDSDSPEKIEKIVTRNIECELWTNYSHLIIQHGRKVCHAGRPQCEKCVLADICKKKDIKK
jgi:endonuclease-3